MWKINSNLETHSKSDPHAKIVLTTPCPQSDQSLCRPCPECRERSRTMAADEIRIIPGSRDNRRHSTIGNPREMRRKQKNAGEERMTPLPPEGPPSKQAISVKISKSSPAMPHSCHALYVWMVQEWAFPTTTPSAWWISGEIDGCHGMDCWNGRALDEKSVI